MYQDLLGMQQDQVRAGIAELEVEAIIQPAARTRRSVGIDFGLLPFRSSASKTCV
jgi:hypothetical protein